MASSFLEILPYLVLTQYAQNVVRVQLPCTLTYIKDADLPYSYV